MTTDDLLARLARCTAERDHYIRLFTRLDAAVSHHRQSVSFVDVDDEALYLAQIAVLRDAAAGPPPAPAKNAGDGPGPPLQGSDEPTLPPPPSGRQPPRRRRP